MKALMQTTPTLSEVQAFVSKPVSTPSAAIWTITPDVAEYLIDPNSTINAGNRDVKANEITALAKDMVEGLWMLTGDSIKLGWNGTLLDGQHRLRACAKVGIEFTTLVLTGLDPKFYTTMDTGKGKSASDIFKKAGVKYHSVVSSATQHLRRWTSSAPITDRSTDKPHVLLELHQNHWPDLPTFAGNQDVLTIKRFLKHPHGTLTALYALLHSVDAKAADSFFAEWAACDVRCDGGKNTPVRVMQRALNERNANLAIIGGRMDDRDRVLMVIKAWRAHAFGGRVVANDFKSISARSNPSWEGVYPVAEKAA